MIGRLIRDKGVSEYVEAARRVRRVDPTARFQLLGALDPNPSGISARDLEAWRLERAIEYLGTTSDVRPYLASAHVCVLPSYGEGMPRALLEAMAMGRAVLTTDVPGCRETVGAGRNGLLVPARDAVALAAGMLQMLADPGRLETMGRESRAIAEDLFDVHSVNRVILGAMGLA
jgi:glycosyltransferase involved in cell wall biosynthesis